MSDLSKISGNINVVGLWTRERSDRGDPLRAVQIQLRGSALPTKYFLVASAIAVVARYTSNDIILGAMRCHACFAGLSSL